MIHKSQTAMLAQVNRHCELRSQGYAGTHTAHHPKEPEMSKNEQDLRTMLARHHTEYQQHSSNARAIRNAEDEDNEGAAIEAQLALAASNAMNAIAILIAREPAAPAA